MLIEKQNFSNISRILSYSYKTSIERLAKVTFDRIIWIPNAKQLKYKPQITQIEMAKQVFISTPMQIIEEKKNYLIKYVINQRNFFSSLLSRFLNKFYTKLFARKTMLINRIIILRTYSVTLIQNYFRTYITHRHFKQMLYKTKAIFLYRFKYHNSTSIDVQVKKDIMSMSYSPYLKCYYLKINKKVLKRNIKVHFIIDGTKIIDSRYAVINDGKGNYYNIIQSSTLFRTMKERSPKYCKRSINESKYYEQLFKCKRKTSIEYSSVSDRSDISTELNHNMLWSYTCKTTTELKQMKSILKNRNCLYRKIRKDCSTKSVSFNNTIELSY